MNSLRRIIPKTIKRQIKGLISRTAQSTNPKADGAKRVLVRACHGPTDLLDAMTSSKRIGGNQGNLLYQFSVYRSLCADTAKLGLITYKQFEDSAENDLGSEISLKWDHLVLPLSSRFRLNSIESLNSWAKLIESLTIPVTVVGVGAQIGIPQVRDGTFSPGAVNGRVIPDAELATHNAAVQRFVTAVLDRSASIGVRGKITKNYLISLGLPADRIDVIGCPSLFTWGPTFRMPVGTPQLNEGSAISMSFDHRVDEAAALLDRSARDYRDLIVYMQERLGIQLVITGEETRPNWNGDVRFPVQKAHPLYGEQRLEYFPSAWAWIRRMQSYDFACGPRLHGTVAAILARTPAHLLVHDSRTLEVAEYHGIPHTLTENLSDKTSLEELASRTDFSRFNKLYKKRFNNYLRFLKRNSLPCAHVSPGTELGNFDAAIEKAARAKGIVSGGVGN